MTVNPKAEELRESLYKDSLLLLAMVNGLVELAKEVKAAKTNEAVVKKCDEYERQLTEIMKAVTEDAPDEALREAGLQRKATP